MSKIKKDERYEAKDKQKYRLTNWPEYNRALENRGNHTAIHSNKSNSLRELLLESTKTIKNDAQAVTRQTYAFSA